MDVRPYFSAVACVTTRASLFSAREGSSTESCWPSNAEGSAFMMSSAEAAVASLSAKSNRFPE